MHDTKIKICGLSRIQDIYACNHLTPDMVGFIFAPDSRRYVDKETVIKLKEKLNEGSRVVGVFVDQPLEEILACLKEGVIDDVQLHGHEDDNFIRKLKRKAFSILKYPTVIKAFQVRTKEDLENARSSNADMILLDGGAGDGQVFDWSLLEGFDFERPFMLAGGLGPDNLQQALEQFHPYGVDISSGVETNGRKDSVKVIDCVTKVQNFNRKNRLENAQKRFGEFGGQYVPETLMNELVRLEQAYDYFKHDRECMNELNALMLQYGGRPSDLYEAKNMTRDLGGARIYLKREDLNHTGSHKINNCLGQVLLAKKMGKTRVIAETGAGQHGVATATVAALLGMECEIFMGAKDCERQKLNVYRMELLGAKVHPVTTGTQVLKDAVNEAMREWANRVHDTHYVLGSVMGPHPYPTMVRDFQAVISKEAKEQFAEQRRPLPNVVLACVGGGSNAMGAFYHFIENEEIQLIGCEAAGRGIETGEHAATIATGSIGVFHGMKSLFCQNEYGQIEEVYSISAGLDYPGIGPEHAWLYETGRASYVPITDEEAVSAFEYLARTEGIICAIESAHAVAYARKLAPTMRKDQSIMVCLSGRGDKDVAAIAKYRGVEVYE